MFSRGIWLLVRWRALYASYKIPTFSRIGRDETQESCGRSLPARQSLECSSSGRHLETLPCGAKKRLRRYLGYKLTALGDRLDRDASSLCTCDS